LFLKKIVFYIVVLFSILYGTTLKQLQNMPKSIERDFYIWQFLLQKETSKSDAVAAVKLVFRVNMKLENALEKKTGLHFKKKQKKIPLKKAKYYTQLISKMHQGGNFYKAWLQLSDKEKLAVFNLSGTENRKLLNKKISQKLYEQLTKYNAINQFLFRVNREHLTNLQQVSLENKPIKRNKISYQNLIKLGFKNIKQNNEKLASLFFKSAISKATQRYYKDKAIFWCYLTSRNKNYLHYLAKSYDFNIYKLIALDWLHLPYPHPSTTLINNNRKSPIRIDDPIAWARLKKKIFSPQTNLYQLAQKYNSKESAAYYYYILNKASKDTKQYFPILYKEEIKGYTIDRQALLLALARQESHFIPASISRSFALGMMQFMPFLIRHIAKKRKEMVNYNEIFNPKIALRFANEHLNYLNKYLWHPLFVAYAYNAGIGYTRRMLRKNLFRNQSRYEPYLSLEMINNEQARHYGKKVLANYVIYRMLLGSPIKITTLLKELHKAELTDKFR